MKLRKKAKNLDSTERQNLTAAIKALKSASPISSIEAVAKTGKTNVYDQLVMVHAGAMAHAHQGPAFLPWHRQYLLNMEQQLEAQNNSVALPYWDWAEDSLLTDPKTAPVWSENLMGGNGVPQPSPDTSLPVESGPFKRGSWTLADGKSALVRALGASRWPPHLSSPTEVATCLSQSTYSTFRPYLEGGDGSSESGGMHN